MSVHAEELQDSLGRKRRQGVFACISVPAVLLEPHDIIVDFADMLQHGTAARGGSPVRKEEAIEKANDKRMTLAWDPRAA